jgi:cytochrome c biogenesis protein CcmG, thiol:disulfide interchange protein DsbE
MPRALKLTAQALSVALVAGLLALLVWKVAHQNRNTAASEISKGKTGPAPAFDLPRLDTSGKLSLASLRGKAVVLNFWQSSCEPCKQEAPALEAAWQRLRRQGVTVVGVDVYDFKSDARAFAKKYGVTYPLVHDTAGSTIESYGLTGYPETYFVDRRGKLVPIHILSRIDAKQNADAFARAVQLALRA